MIQDTKDSVASIATIAGTGAAVMGWNEILTFVLIITGIALNVTRIYTIRQKHKQEQENND